MLEKQIEKKINDAAKKMGIFVRKFTSQFEKGNPDRIYICLCGDIFFIEFKSEFGKLSDIQEKTISEIRKRKIKVFVVNSVSKGFEILNAHKNCSVL